jgi:hypothetical protein
LQAFRISVLEAKATQELGNIDNVTLKLLQVAEKGRILRIALKQAHTMAAQE